MRAIGTVKTRITPNKTIETQLTRLKTNDKPNRYMRIKKRLNGKALRQVFALVNGLYFSRNLRTRGVGSEKPARIFRHPLLLG